MKLGLLALGRATFDVPFAERKLAAMLRALQSSGHELVGPKELLFDANATQAAVANLQAQKVDQVLVLQVTFTDAAAIVSISSAFSQPLSIWAVPEPRQGGRLRLNAFCGLNLAAHALGLNGHVFGWLYADPEGDVAEDLRGLLAGGRVAGHLSPAPPPATNEDGQHIATALRGRRIARIGAHPEGFATCDYDAKALRDLAGVEVDALSLDVLFDTARVVGDDTAAELRKVAEEQIQGLDTLDQDQLDRSLRLKGGLEKIRSRGKYDAFAIRCWPETFTEYGGAVCGPAAMMGENRVPCACEADVYGALTQLALQEAAQAPVFLTDLVDMDVADNTGVVWHCGQAPLSMRDLESPASGTVHTNRQQPLLLEFPLKPGPVTFLRISQAFNEPKMVLGFGEMLRRPMAFTGTSGVIRFERPAAMVLSDIIDTGLEHHMALAYGDHRVVLRGLAGALGLPLQEL